MRRILSAFALVATWAWGCGAAVAADSSYDRLQALAHDLTFQWAKLHPLVATAQGIAGEDGRLEVPSLASDQRDLALVRTWEARLAAIPTANESLPVRDDAKLLRSQLVALERRFTVYRTDRRDYSAPGTAVMGGVYTQFEHIPIVGEEGATEADVRSAWEDIISRLGRVPAYISGGESLVTEPGHLQGVVGADQLGGAPDLFGGALTDAARAQLPADAFARFVSARDGALKAIAQEKAYIDAHAASWPENFVIGRRAYDAMLRDEQLLPFDAQAVIQMGLDELAHGWSVSYWIQHVVAERQTPLGPQTGGGLAPGGKALIAFYRDQIDYLHRFMGDHHIVTVPSWLGRINVVETPKFLQPISPGASMNSPRLFSKETQGFYFITPPVSLADAAARLDANEDFDRDRILSTAGHEAIPGHFLQLSTARRQPDFVRKIEYSGSFAEGWAYYGEEMLIVVGLYGDDLDPRYDVAQWERVRGARAIVDAKLASGDMTEPQAVTYFAAQTGFTTDAAKAQVDGMALDPGDLIAYTVGRQQLDLLMHDYYVAVGASGSLQDFHDRLLSYGTTPFSVVAPELLADAHKPLADVRAAAGAPL